LRRDESDSILDVTIGLEALLVPDSRSESTYKLAMRAAALCKLEPFEGYAPERIFSMCKRIYDFRSAVVHGGDKIEKERMIKIEDGKELLAVVLGANLLRHVILSLCKRPDYFKPENLDNSLLEGAKGAP